MGTIKGWGGVVMLPEKPNLKAIFKRLRLFKELEPDFKIDKVVYLKEITEFDDKIIVQGAYIVSKPFASGVSGDTIVTIIDLENTMRGHDFDIHYKTYKENFTCWRINIDYFEENFKIDHLLAMHEFIYKGGKDDD